MDGGLFTSACASCTGTERLKLSTARRVKVWVQNIPQRHQHLIPPHETESTKQQSFIWHYWMHHHHISSFHPLNASAFPSERSHSKKKGQKKKGREGGHDPFNYILPIHPHTDCQSSNRSLHQWKQVYIYIYISLSHGSSSKRIIRLNVKHLQEALSVTWVMHVESTAQSTQWTQHYYKRYFNATWLSSNT